MQDPGRVRGVSSILEDYKLSGVGRGGEDLVGSGSVQALRGAVTLSTVCPEPAGLVLIGVSVGLWLCWRGC